MLEQRAEPARREHEQPETERLDQVFGPVALERGAHGALPSGHSGDDHYGEDVGGSATNSAGRSVPGDGTALRRTLAAALRSSPVPTTVTASLSGETTTERRPAGRGRA